MYTDIVNYEPIEITTDMLYRAKILDPVDKNNPFVTGLYFKRHVATYDNRVFDFIQPVYHLSARVSHDGVMIDGNTLCRCSGFRDKNDELIFQHDRVRVEYVTDAVLHKEKTVRQGTVELIDGCFVFVAENRPKDLGKIYTPISKFVRDRCIELIK